MCSPDINIPDPSAAQLQAAKMNSDIAQKQLDLQKDSLDYFKQRQVGVDATANEVTKRQLEMAQLTQDQGTELYNYQKDVFRPVEQSLVSQAMRESTPDYYEQFAQKAVAAQAGANANAQGQVERNMASMGVNPNSGAWMAGERGIQLGNAAALGSVANDSRDKAQALGWAHKADVAGIGKGLVGAGNASYGLAMSGNDSATKTVNGATTTAAGTLGTATQYGGAAVGAAGNASQGYNDIYRTQVNGATAPGQQGGGLMGALGNAAGQFAGSTAGSAMIAGFI